MDGALGEIDELLNVFQALLRIARVESGEPRSGFAPVDLASLLEELLDVYAPVAEAEAHVLHADIAPQSPVYGDRELLVQMFVNLIENAIRHTPAGTTITVRLVSDDGVVQAGVSDDGPGIPAQAHGQGQRRRTLRSPPHSGRDAWHHLHTSQPAAWGARHHHPRG